MNYSRTTLENGLFVDTDWDRTLTSVRVTDTRYGVTARGNAKLHPDDEFDINIGQRLAYIRATQRLLRKVERKMVQNPSLAKHP